MKATDRQVGGDHYKTGMQPLELATQLNLNPFQLKIVKYVTRYKSKNGRQDLEKAVHIAEMAKELKPKNFIWSGANLWNAEDTMDNYFKSNNIQPLAVNAMNASLYDEWNTVIENVNELINQEYGN